MPIHNAQIAEQFNHLADLLEIEGANPFRVRAYRYAARMIDDLSRELSDMVARGEDLTQIPGIGADLAQKIKTMIRSGKFQTLKEAEKRLPKVLTELMRIEGLGPKRIKVLYDKLGIRSIADLKKAAKGKKIQELRGFGDVMVKRILSGIDDVTTYSRHRLYDVSQTVDEIVVHLKRSQYAEDVAVAGSFRRRKETIGDVDILVAAKKGKEIVEHFLKMASISQVVAKGPTRSTIKLKSGLQVDLRVVQKKSFGAALVYFTGSKPHNIALRKIALKKKLKINEYGVFKGKKQIAGATEKDVYQSVGLPYIEPELREDRGEIEAAQKRKLPKLITIDDIRGDLHCHTNETDGVATLEAMVKAAQQKGYAYIAITDHSKHLAMTNGFDEKRLLKQIKAIDKLNAKLKGIVVLKSIEVDILENGKLDLRDDVLKELDLTVCSVHSRFGLSKEKQTERIIRAMDNRYFNILGHPYGRLINRRQPYQIDLEAILAAAKERGCFVEMNAQRDRLDLDDVQAKMAKEMGVKLAISTDSHSTAQLSWMQNGIDQARRGWIEAQDVINTRSLRDLRVFLKR